MSENDARPVTASDAASGPAQPRGALFFVALAGIAALIACEAWIASTRQFNWDEYLFLNKLYRFAAGELTTPFQSFYVHFYGWLRGIGDIHDQLVIGRLTMVACQAITCASIYAVARRFVGPAEAAIAVFAYLASGTTLSQGASFRADPLAAAFAMSALAVVAAAPLRLLTLAAATLLAGFAMLVTAKALFFAPAWIAFGIHRLISTEGWSLLDRRAIGVIALGSAVAGLLFALHYLSLGNADLAASGSTIGAAGEKVLFDAGLIPQPERIRFAASVALPQTAMLLVAFYMLLRGRARGEHSGEFWLLLAAASPLLSLLFYRNAYLYFFPFIVPSAFVLIAWLARKYRDEKALVWIGMLALAVTGALGVANALTPNQQVQRQVVDAVSTMFPKPVHVIDRNYMIADYPRDMFFMSTWGIENYRKGAPFAEDYLRRAVVPLLIVNGPAIAEALGLPQPVRPEHRLLETDRRVLADNFIPHWGAVWVAGKRLQGSVEITQFQVLVPGTYTLEGGPATIDGEPLEEGGTLVLERGEHAIALPDGEERTLRWGDHLPRPEAAPPTLPIFQPGGDV